MPEKPYKLRNRRIATLPNLLSLIRVLLLGPTLLALERQPEWGTLPALLTIASALGTDALDGLFARWRGSVSDTGRALDPVADKIYLGGLVLYLALARGFPWWLVAAVLVRDLLLVVAGAFLFRRHRVVFAANLWGKVSTIVLSVLVLVYVLRVGWAVPWISAAAAAAVVVSLAAYVRNGVRFLRSGAAQAA